MTPFHPHPQPTRPSACHTALELAGAHAVHVLACGALEPENPARLARLLGGAADALDLSAQGWEARLEPEAVQRRRQALASLNWPGAQAQLDYDVADDQGGTRRMREVLRLHSAAAGEGGPRISGVLIDRTDAHQVEARAAWLARHDALTGLPNTPSLLEQAAPLAAAGARLGATAHLLRLRATNLDDLADVYGHDCTDRLLRLVSDRLRDNVRVPDVAARVNGGDFAVAVLGADVEAVRARLLAQLCDTPYSTPFGPLYLDFDPAHTALAHYPGAVRHALTRLGAELDSGGARDGAPVPAVPSAPAEPDADVLAALDADRISLAFQPVVSARTGETAHHECLLRLRTQDGRVVSAGAIVQQAERLGLVSRLDERALALALPHLARHADLHLALNVSAGTVQDGTASARYLAQLSGAGELARRITVEMTETLAVDDPGAAARFSGDVRALGCRFAVDDFGSGYTTFRNLMAVEADQLKIDGALIRGIAVDAGKQTFMRMMVDLAQTFGVETVAEMVETDADAAMLRRLGADYLQGYAFGHPAPAPVWSRMEHSALPRTGSLG